MESKIEILLEGIDEGILDQLRAAVGLAPREGTFSKREWEEIASNYRSALGTFVESPGIRNKSAALQKLLEIIIKQDPGLASKARDVRDNMLAAGRAFAAGKTKEEKLKNLQKVKDIVDEMEKEARSVYRRAQAVQRSPIGDDIEKIAEMITDELEINNGLAI